MTENENVHTRWAMIFHDDVAEWLRPFRALYASKGHDADDIAQIGRLALLEQGHYITARMKTVAFEYMAFARNYAKKIVLRAVKRAILGQRKDTTPTYHEPLDPDRFTEIADREHNEHTAHVQLELIEAIEAAPPLIGYYLGVVLGQHPRMSFNDVSATLIDADTNGAVRTAAGNYLLNWFNAYNWFGKEKRR